METITGEKGPGIIGGLVSHSWYEPISGTFIQHP